MIAGLAEIERERRGQRRESEGKGCPGGVDRGRTGAGDRSTSLWFPSYSPFTFRAVYPRMRARPRTALQKMGLGSVVVLEPLPPRCPGLQAGLRAWNCEGSGLGTTPPHLRGTLFQSQLPCHSTTECLRRTRFKHHYTCSSTHLLLRKQTKRKGEARRRRSVLYGLGG